MYCNGWLLMNEAALGGNIFHIIFSTVDLLSELNKKQAKNTSIDKFCQRLGLSPIHPVVRVMQRYE